MENLIAGRECGECRMCCITPMIDNPDMQKKSGAVCAHCVSGPCDIYQTRPPVCRDFFCAWRSMEAMGPEWRPDKSGVFARIETRNIPPGFANRTGISLTLVANPLKTVRQPWFIDFVAGAVANKIPLFLMVPGPVGYGAAKALLNTPAFAEAAVTARSRVKQLLEEALKGLAAYRFQEDVLSHSGNDVSSQESG